MPGILDSFYVMIGLDPRGYDEGADAITRKQDELVENTQKTGDQVEQLDKKQDTERRKRQRQQVDDNRKVAESFDGVKRQALGAFAVLIGANSIKDFVSKSVNDFSNMERAAKAAGLEVRDLAGFGRAVEANGGDPAAARASLSGLAAKLENWRTLGIVDPQTLLAMSRIGAGPQDDALEVFQKFAKWSEGKDSRLVSQEGGLLGFDEASIDLAMKGGEAVKKAMADAKASLPSEAEIKSIKELQRAWRELTNDIKGNAYQILTNAAPALTNLLELVDHGVDKFPTLTKWVLALGTALTGLGSIKIGANILKLFGIGGGEAAGAAAAGTVTGGEVVTGAGAVAAAPAVGIAALIATIAYAVTPTKANEGEDDIMAGINRRWEKNGRPNQNPAEDWFPGEPQGNATGGKSGNVQQRAAAAQQYFVSQGFAPQEAAGMVAGMRAENSQLDPTAKNPNSSAFGLGQWLNTRQRDYGTFATQTGRMNMDIKKSSFEDQLSFIVWELKHTETKALSKIQGKDAHGAMMGYLADFMRPGEGLAGDVRRGKQALTQQITVGTVVVNTKATDAKGVATGIRSALATSPQVNGTNSGLN